MAGLVLMFMIAVMVVVLFFRLVMQKPVKKYLLASSIILGSYLVTVSCACGPNPKDVAVMKPMAEKIADYIVKHGIPKSLEEIPGLPYKIYQKENKTFYYFEVKSIEYQIFDSGITKVIEAMHKRDNGYTAVWITFKKDKNNRYKKKPLEFVLIHGNGICSSMKQ